MQIMYYEVISFGECIQILLVFYYNGVLNFKTDLQKKPLQQLFTVLKKKLHSECDTYYQYGDRKIDKMEYVI